MMLFLNYFLEGLRNLFFAKLRTYLALLGMTVGVASVVAMLLGGELATNETLKQFQTLGTHLLALSLHAKETNENADSHEQPITLQQAMALLNADPHIEKLAPYTQIYYAAYYNDAPLGNVILGVTDDFKPVFNLKLQFGRFVSLLDQYTPYCVIGASLYTQIKQMTFKDPVGQQLMIGNTLFTIVGVLAHWPQNKFINVDIDETIFVPIQASFMMSRYATINNIVMRLTKAAPLTAIKNHLTKALMTNTNQLALFQSAEELIDKMHNQRRVLTTFLGLIGGLSLLVGGIGVMNMMLITVDERRREIGVRRAVGATHQAIARLFLMEALILSVTAGLFGTLLGLLMTYLFALIRHWQFTVILWPIATGFSASLITGLFFGFFPAYRAARVDPIVALRAEC